MCGCYELYCFTYKRQRLEADSENKLKNKELDDMSYLLLMSIKTETVVKENERKEISTLKGIYFSKELA